MYGSSKPESEEEKAKKAQELQRIDHIIDTLQKIRGEYDGDDTFQISV